MFSFISYVRSCSVRKRIIKFGSNCLKDKRKIKRNNCSCWIRSNFKRTQTFWVRVHLLLQFQAAVNENILNNILQRNFIWRSHSCVRVIFGFNHSHRTDPPSKWTFTVEIVLLCESALFYPFSRYICTVTMHKFYICIFWMQQYENFRWFYFER